MKYAVITGASSGMGLEFARQLAERGYGIVVISDRSDENRRAARTRTGGRRNRCVSGAMRMCG